VAGLNESGLPADLGYGNRWLMWTHDGSVLNVEQSSKVVFSRQFLKAIADWQERKEAGEFSEHVEPLWEMVATEPIEEAAGTLVICNHSSSLDSSRRAVWRLTGEMQDGGYVGVWPD
jgi:hypothetical protein